VGGRQKMLGQPQPVFEIHSLARSLKNPRASFSINENPRFWFPDGKLRPVPADPEGAGRPSWFNTLKKTVFSPTKVAAEHGAGLN
jgi:hypothetical protein